MKHFLCLMVLLGTLASSLASANDQKICDMIEAKMQSDCDHIACDDSIANGTFRNMNACTSASDYGEYAQGACDGQPTLQDLVKDYNKKHPTKKISCQE